MGRQATAASRNAQKWQVAGSRNESAVDMPSEDEHGGSTRIPSSGGASPSASSTELGRQATATDAARADAPFHKTAEQIQKEKDERARWADVESDGEEAEVFNGEYRNAARNEPEGWATVGKKPKNGKPPHPQKTRAVKADPTPPAPRPPEAPRQAAAKRAEEKTSAAAYRPPKHEKSTAREDHYWEASSWGSSGRGGDAWSSSKRGGSTWDEGSWSKKSEVRSAGYPKADFPKADFRGGNARGLKEKNESFKRGPQVAVNMDSSRLAW